VDDAGTASATGQGAQAAPAPPEREEPVVPAGVSQVTARLTGAPVPAVGGGQTGWLRGTVFNSRARPLRRARVELYARRDGRLVRLARLELAFVPAQVPMPFSAAYQSVSGEQAAAATAVVVEAEEAQPDVVCWHVPPAAYAQTVADARTVRVEGTLANPTPEPLREVRVLCETYTKAGLHRGRAEAALAGGPLGGGQRRPFAVSCRDDRGAAMIARCFVRAWGRRGGS